MEHNHHLKQYWLLITSFVLLLAGLALDYSQFSKLLVFCVFLAAYLPVGLPVLKEAVESFAQKEFFTEFTLMSVATICAFLIGEYPEAVAVMLFYCVGELLQERAVAKAQVNIKSLLDVRAQTAEVLREGIFIPEKPENVGIGEKIRVKSGEKVPLDGVLLSEKSSFNTAALTGESRPQTLRKGETVLAGMLNIDTVVEIETIKLFSDSSLARILDMVQNATERKAKTELIIRRFARIYTPIVFFLALAISTLPYFFMENYVFSDWLYRGLVFLVISCPCALVISVPLGYFGGIGAASRAGILFKGADFLDLTRKISTVVMDKTGTLTKGVFRVIEVVSPLFEKNEFIKMVAALEKQSNHPVAKAIVEYAPVTLPCANEVTEIAGCGLQGTINKTKILVGNAKLMKKFSIEYDSVIDNIVETTVLAAIDGVFAGYIVIADEIKEDAAQAILEMRLAGVRNIVMLSGDKNSIVQKVSENLCLNAAYGNLLPEEKVQHIERLKNVSPAEVLAFVGDGINDAPALALADVGIAMGAMGSDVAIEIADVVVQTDQPSKIATAIKLARATHKIINQNLFFAIFVKVIIMIFSVLGFASMWAAVFADVGVALLCVLNSVKILRETKKI